MVYTSDLNTKRLIYYQGCMFFFCLELRLVSYGSEEPHIPFNTYLCIAGNDALLWFIDFLFRQQGRANQDSAFPSAGLFLFKFSDKHLHLEPGGKGFSCLKLTISLYSGASVASLVPRLLEGGVRAKKEPGTLLAHALLYPAMEWNTQEDYRPFLGWRVIMDVEWSPTPCVICLDFSPVC